METYQIKRNCPDCNEKNTVTLKKNYISCSNCSFKTQYNCPLCNHPVKENQILHDSQGDFFDCSSCKKKVHLIKIQYLINNLMKISTEHTCKFCNGPTVCRLNANIGHRCFFFPKCSGQASLFGTQQESLVFLDFETTGLEVGKDHLIEIGALKIDKNGFEHVFDTFIKPPIPLPEKITSITKITDSMLEQAPPIKHVIEDFFNFIGDSTIVAHNADFDIPWLILETQKHNLTLPNNNIICTFKWAKELKENRCSLGALTKKYNIGHLNSHRALADSGATKELFFIFENFQTIPRPIQKIDHYLTIVNKITAKINQ